MRVSMLIAIRQFAAALAALLLLASCGPPRADRIVIGSKNFTEQLVLGEIIAQQIENKTHLPVERRFYLAGTYILPPGATEVRFGKGIPGIFITAGWEAANSC